MPVSENGSPNAFHRQHKTSHSVIQKGAKARVKSSHPGSRVALQEAKPSLLRWDVSIPPAAFRGWQDTSGCSLGSRPEAGLAKEEIQRHKVTFHYSNFCNNHTGSRPICLTVVHGSRHWTAVLAICAPRAARVSVHFNCLLNTSGAVVIPWTMLLSLRFGAFCLHRW